MKAMKQYRIKFHCQMSLIGILATIGLFAVCGEPDECLAFGAWLRVFGCQLAVCAVCWLAAWLLYRHWDMGRTISRLDWIERAKRKQNRQD